VIDRLRDQIQERLDQLLGEADRLRKALRALGPGTPKAPAAKAATPKPAAGSDASSTASAPKRTPARRRSTSATRPARRTAPGATKTAVLAALAGGEAMTAGEVAAKAGLPRPTVSTTLSRLANSGEVQKADRGYRLAGQPPSTSAR
jgi:hypothetical protein